MLGSSFEIALAALLSANNIATDELHSIHHNNAVLEYLKSHGLELHRKSLLYPTVPDEEAQIGCIASLPDGLFLSILGTGEEAILLNQDGSAFRLINSSDLAQVTEVFIVIEKPGNITRVSSYLSCHKKKLLEIFLCGVLINLFALSLPLFSSFVYDKVLGNGITSTMWALVIGLFLIMAIEFSLRIIRIIIAEHISRLSDTEIDSTMFRNLLHTKSNALPSVGGVLEKYKQVISYRDFLSSTYVLALADLPFLLLFIFSIIIISGPLVLVGLVCGVMVVVTNAIFVLPAFDYEKKSRGASEKRLGLLADVITAHDALIGASACNALARKWRSASLTVTQSSSMARIWYGLGQTTTNSLSFLSYIGVLIGGVYMIEGGFLTSGGLLATSMLTARMMGYFSSLSTLLVRYQEFRNALNELNKIFAVTNKSYPKKSNVSLDGTLRLNRVTCNIGHGGYPVFKDISLQINAGEIVGIAGAIGGGKSTLLRLIAGVLQPDEGQILIGDIPLQDLSPEEISKNIGFKPQDICLMEGTIEENIIAGRSELTPEVRKYLLETTGLIKEFQENGLHWKTEIGQRGVHLSGGQKQLVALARAIAFQPQFILLDEPTNGVDASLEEYMAKQLRHMKGKSTILISTHSRQILSVCDRIIVVGKSKILANGPRDKVLL